MPTIERVTPDENLPASADVVVIGGGIAGVCTALELQARGLKTVVVEKGEIAAEQSSRNWGWCRQMGRDAREIPLILESMRIWRGMNEGIDAETGFRTCGITYLAETEAEAAKYESWLNNHAKPAGIDSRMISGAELDGLVPGSAARFKSALYTPSDARAEPFIAVPAMARALQKRGAQVFTNTAARGVETSAGRVSSVVTERGTIKCRAALLAGGYWSRHFLANLDIDFPQLGVLASVQRTTALENAYATTFSGGKFTARKRADGGFTITHNHLSVAEITPANFKYFMDFWPMLKLEWRGFKFRLGQRFITEATFKKRWALDEVTPFEQVRILDPEPTHAILDEAMSALKAYFPAFAPVQVAERWAGIIDAAPDAVPVIAPVQAVPGLYLSSGYSGHGFGLGPGAGKLMAQLIAGETPCVDPIPFRFERFRDGSRPQPTTGV
jgi:glycine/D-amino acid oxidase-like deaminating enzyme